MTDKTNDMIRAALQLSNVLYVTSGAHCEYKAMRKHDIKSINEAFEKYHVRQWDTNNYPVTEGREYMVITCENGHKYYVDVTWDSPLTACAETISFAAKKL